uniref:Uncharacterized protein n=1 Tax=Oryza nivara TaxID=4536 RepID=A0A0E0HCE4_ORYNI
MRGCKRNCTVAPTNKTRKYHDVIVDLEGKDDHIHVTKRIKESCESTHKLLEKIKAQDEVYFTDIWRKGNNKMVRVLP